MSNIKKNVDSFSKLLIIIIRLCQILCVNNNNGTFWDLKSIFKKQVAATTTIQEHRLQEIFILTVPI